MAISNLEKAETVVNTLSKVHSSGNLSEEERRGREETRTEVRYILRIFKRKKKCRINIVDLSH